MSFWKTHKITLQAEKDIFENSVQKRLDLRTLIFWVKLTMTTLVKKYE